MDVHMPEMDGFEATRRIRAFEKERFPKTGASPAPGASAPGDSHRDPYQPIPIVAMTANVFREDVEKCLAAGMNDHVGKPLNMEAVMEKLRTYLPGKLSRS
jgi:CheY-like chemotaxis protein